MIQRILSNDTRVTKPPAVRINPRSRDIGALERCRLGDLTSGVPLGAALLVHAQLLDLLGITVEILTLDAQVTVLGVTLADSSVLFFLVGTHCADM